MVPLGERLRIAREESGYTQQDMADFLEVRVRTYQHYEAGSHNPTLDALTKMCERLNVSSDWLLGLTDERRGS